MPNLSASHPLQLCSSTTLHPVRTCEGSTFHIAINEAGGRGQHTHLGVACVWLQVLQLGSPLPDALAQRVAAHLQGRTARGTALQHPHHVCTGAGPLPSGACCRLGQRWQRRRHAAPAQQPQGCCCWEQEHSAAHAAERPAPCRCHAARLQLRPPRPSAHPPACAAPSLVRSQARAASMPPPLVNAGLSSCSNVCF